MRKRETAEPKGLEEERVSNANGYLGSKRATHAEGMTCAKALRQGQAR